MKRLARTHAFLVALSVTIGVACTYVVAWRCFVYGRIDESQMFRGFRPADPATPDDIAWFARHAPVGMALPTEARQQTATGYHERTLIGGQNQNINYTQRCRAGWPLPAVAGEEFRWKPSGAVRDQREYRGVILFRDRLSYMPPRIPYLPARPLWPGFAINTLLYATIAGLLLAAPFALQRRRRIKRGLCPKCAYPVGESAVCTECGAAVSRVPG